LAYMSETTIEGSLLLAAYSAGLSLPFLLSAPVIGHLIDFIKRKRVRYVLYFVERISGLLLIAIGVLIFTDRLVLLNSYFDFLLPTQ